MRAARQGTFDGLCGIYAIINALDPAGVKLRRGPLHTDLFKELTHGLGAVSLLAAMHEGLERDDLLRAAKAAFRWLALEHGIELTIEAPYAKHRFRQPATFIKAVRGHLAAEGQALILYVNMPNRDHWTVPTAIIGRRLFLRDSGGTASIPLSRLTPEGTDWAFSAADTILIRKVG